MWQTRPTCFLASPKLSPKEYARQAWEIMERLGDRCTGACAEHIRIEALNNLGNALRAQGRYAEAEEWLLRAARPAAEYEMDATVVLNSLGVLYKYTGRFDEAEQLYQKVLDKTSHAGFRAS